MHEVDLIEFLIKEGHTDIAESIKDYSCKRGDDTERYEKSAMQLVAQINLADIADLDIENKLPHTGILYFFWSGDIDSIHQTN